MKKLLLFLLAAWLWAAPALATDLVVGHAISLSASNPIYRSPNVTLGALTSDATVQIRRPTAAHPVDWDESSIVRVSIVLIVDGVEYRATGTPRGGVRTNARGQEIDAYRLKYYPTVMLGDRGRDYLRTAIKDENGYYRDVPLTRVGETGALVQGYVLLEWVSGTIDTEITLAATTEAPAPVLAKFHNSVAFDAHTASEDIDGGTTHSLSHTASGSNRAAFIGIGGYESSTGLTISGVTYGGAAATERWDVGSSGAFVSAGYSYVAPAASSQTVEVTVPAEPEELFMSVITFTGVDQTTPVGTQQTATGNGTSASVTVTGTSADGFLADSLIINTGAASITVGANQTGRASLTGSGFGTHFRTSTQDGADGGVMSWSWTNSQDYAYGAIEFKPVAVGDVEGCYLMENNTDFYLMENNVDFYALEGGDGGLCTGGGGGGPVPAGFKAKKYDRYFLE